MATIAVTKKYTSGTQWASLIFTLTYSVNNSDPANSALTCSSLKITTGQSTASTTAQKEYLRDAKNQRTMALANGVAFKVVYNGVTIANTTTHSTGSQSISTAARNVSKTHATQTKTLTLTGAGVSKSASVSIPVRTSYKVTYNANGGSGAPDAQTKWHGEPLPLSYGVPTRSGYRFKCWNTNAGGTGTNYNGGADYNGNAALNLYAVWEPWITGITLSMDTLRVADGTSTVEADEGTWCHGQCMYTVTGEAAGALTLTVTVSPQDTTKDPPEPDIQLDTFVDTKEAGQPLTGYIDFWASGCSTESSYTFTVAAECENTTQGVSQTVTKSLGDVMSPAYYVMDVLGDKYWDRETQTGERPGHGIAFGAPCQTEGFHVAMPADFTEAITLANGSSVFDNQSGEIHLLTPEMGTLQSEFSFGRDGKLYARKRTRTNATAAWGAWSAWLSISM